MSFYTADLCDANEDLVCTTEPVFSIFGARVSFGGPIRTLRVFEDNSRVKDALSGAGDGAVLVVYCDRDGVIVAARDLLRV